MGMMARMRSLAPWFILTVGGLFVLFMVLSDSKLTQLMGRQSMIIGTIEGEEITSQEFAQFVDQAKMNQEQQTGREFDEAQMNMLRDQVWDLLVKQKLVEKKIEELGLEVTDDEIRDVILGPNPPAFLKNSFIDSTGNFNRAAYESAIYDANNKMALIQAEEAVRNQKIQEKLRSYVTASVVVSQEELKRSYQEKNIQMDADYVLVNSSLITDSEIEVTDAKIEQYYKDNRELYKIDPQRKLKYVLFRKQAATADSNAVKQSLESIVPKLKNDPTLFESYAQSYGDLPYGIDTVSLTRISADAASKLSEAENGEIVGPVLTSQGYAIYRMNGVINSDDVTVRASHILIRDEGNPEEAKAEADKVYQQLKSGADFAELAKQVSEDPGSAVKGGDLGWFGRGAMVPEFEKASFDGKVGEIQEPVQTTFGYHIIKVTGKSNKKYILEQIVKSVDVSGATIDRIQEKANEFAYLASEDGFETTADDYSYVALETPGFKDDVASIPGIGQNSGLKKFAFENNVGDISDVYSVSSGYVVATVSEIIKAGYKPFEEVKEQAKVALVRKLKKEKAMEIASNIKEKIQHGNLQPAKSVYPKAVISEAAGFTGGATVPGVGRDFAFISAALDAELNTIAGPVAGNKGAYLIDVTHRTEFDSSKFAMQKNLLRDQLLQRKKSSVFNEWLENLAANADVEDYRFRFYK